jgi:hypothetical protein
VKQTRELLAVQIAFMREAWRSNDGAEGDTVKAVCDAAESLLQESARVLALAERWERESTQVATVMKDSPPGTLRGVQLTLQECARDLVDAINGYACKRCKGERLIAVAGALGFKGCPRCAGSGREPGEPS